MTPTYISSRKEVNEMNGQFNSGNVGVDGGNSGIIVGGGNGGSVYVGGASAPQPYGRRSVKLLPITERGMALLSALTTVVMFATGAQSVRGLLQNLRSPMDLRQPTQIWEIYGFIAAGLILAFAMTARRTIKDRTHHYSRFSWLPGVAGVHGPDGRKRLALVRNSGTCQTCGGDLRFYSKVTAWHTEVVDGRSRRVVDERSYVAECKRNGRHVWEIDPTDTDDLSV